MVAATIASDTAEAAFERLFASEYRRVASVAFRITRDEAEAEDVAQEVFVQFARSRRDAARAQTWLYRAAVHAALNAVRSRRRRAEREARQYRLQRPLDEGGDPSGIVESLAQARAVRAALLRIGARRAELLALRYAGLTYREIAGITGIDETHIGTHLARAERALKREIEREPYR